MFSYKNDLSKYAKVGEMVALVLEPARGWRVVFYMKITTDYLFEFPSRMMAKVSGGPKQTPETAAQEAAESWLRLIDEDKYGESWDELAEIAKTKVTKESWATRRNDRATLKDASAGNQRKLMDTFSGSSLSGTTDLPGVTLIYKVSQTSHTSVSEMIEVVREPTRGWRVALYLKTAFVLLFDPSAGERTSATSEPQATVGLVNVPVGAPSPPSPGTGGGMGYGPGRGGIGSGSGIHTSVTTAADARDTRD